MDVEKDTVIKNLTPSVTQIEVADQDPANRVKQDRKLKQNYLLRKPSNIYQQEKNKEPKCGSDGFPGSSSNEDDEYEVEGSRQVNLTSVEFD